MEKQGKSRSNQKLKMMYLHQILLENTDATHTITTQEIIDKLAVHDVTAERKSIYNDIEHLRRMGIDVKKIQAKRTYSYRIENRQFSLPELKLLVDSVQSAKFITKEKSNELIKKIESCASKYEASQLQRQVYVANRVKSMNESIFANVDIIHQAMTKNVMVKFQYFYWDVSRKMVTKKGGRFYEISPWGLSWNDGNYYMIGFDNEESKIKHYRVDKMLSVEITETKRLGRDLYENLDMAEYSKKHFDMFDGEEKRVTLLCKNDKAGILIDRFGDDVSMFKKDAEHFEAKIKVAVSRHFLGWIMALGPDVKITGPEAVVNQMKDEIKRLREQYESF